MKPFNLFFFILLLWSSENNLLFAQPIVSDIRVEIDVQRVKVTYNISDVSVKDSVYLQVEGKKQGFLKMKTLSGDIGRNITAGINKVIVWEYALDGEQLDEEIRPIIGIVEFKEPKTVDSIGGGPINALISVIAPGIGNIFVQPYNKIGLRPLITVAYGGLLGYSILQKKRSNSQYSLYQSERYERNAQPYYNKANKSHHEYLIAMSMAASILVTDVAYTFFKGLSNDRKKRNIKQGITLSYADKTPMIGLMLTF
ncbi:hypothetical protein [Telluribacter sp.]|jgi:hypothetical protein|uniref:hypothetical protein n=1 Tax=Telluribacter sp. TaxID=1978767 RepID=UPI002E147BA0|nr:hypothetical protein [Telluribacter sp.]